MTAQEMAEAIGYEYKDYRNTGDNIYWHKRTGDTQSHNIQFIIHSKTVNVHKRNYPYFKSLTIEEHLAIHQQMKELGWIE